MRKTSTIFRQLIYNVIIPSLVALLTLGIINYQNTRKIMVENNKAKNIMIADKAKSILEFQDMSFEILETSMGQRMDGYSNLLVSMYFSDTKNIEKTDLLAIREELGMDTSMEDIYIINRDGIIVNTTFTKDKGLDLFSFGEAHKKYILSVFEGGKFVNERFAIEASTKRLKKYTYQPTIDKKYIIEIGSYSKDADQIIKFQTSALSGLCNLFILTDKLFSFNDSAFISETHKPIVDKICNDKSNASFMEKEGNRTIEYSYIFMDRKNSTLYKGSVVQIVTDRTEDIRLLRIELVKIICIFFFAIIVVVILIYRKTKVITSPIKNLVENINRITHGHLNERADVVGNNEIATLSEQFNKMIEELESYYNELEQKVRDRTAEIMQQKEEIEAQRDELEQQRNLLEKTNQNLNVAYQEISEQKKHITDSIIYAKRIQNAILPPDDYVHKVFREAFILYKPKDIVSGDFYWITEVDGVVMVAAVDCTGHGVPGAFMSIVGHNNLDHTVNETNARHAGEILNVLNQSVTETLRQHRTSVAIRDGMDVALCCFDFKNQKVEFAGANNPLVMVRNSEVIVYDATKAPIGAFVGDKLTNFVQNDIQLQKNDMFYIFSDGYADQFGGTEGKKFMKRKLKELLGEISIHPIEKQKELLESAHIEWKGENEQVDDILIIGVRV